MCIQDTLHHKKGRIVVSDCPGLAVQRTFASAMILHIGVQAASIFTFLSPNKLRDAAESAWKG